LKGLAGVLEENNSNQTTWKHQCGIEANTACGASPGGHEALFFKDASVAEMLAMRNIPPHIIHLLVMCFLFVRR